MKKIFSKKRPVIIFIIAIIVLIPIVIFADEGIDYYRSYALNNNGKMEVISKIGSSTIVNRSDKDFFAPNKTAPEYDAWSKNAPNYVEVSVCGDGVCGDGESATCQGDCPIYDSYCGDGICKQSGGLVMVENPRVVAYSQEYCRSYINKWMFVPTVNIFVFLTGNAIKESCEDKTYTRTVTWSLAYADENWTNCNDDCAAPANGAGDCGVCGFDSLGNACPNFCHDQSYSMVNCVYEPAHTVYPDNCVDETIPVVLNNSKGLVRKYLSASAVLAVGESSSLCIENNSSYTVDAGYRCSFGGDTSNFCPAGYYCAYTGGLKPGTTATAYASNANWLSGKGITYADLQKTCPAGYFCESASTYPRKCPPNTYSTGGAATCTACDAGKMSQAGSDSLEKCVSVPVVGDNVCNGNENPVNSPHDCALIGDGKCTSGESRTTSPTDCFCGDGDCNNGETYLSCLTDCACMDSVCGTSLYANGTTTVFREGKFCKYKGDSTALNQSDCSRMNAGEVCGNGTCETGEGYNSSISRIVCPLDCHCGNGYCESYKGESWNWTTNSGTCQQDCKCGNGTCDSNETSYSCMVDCHCGNSQCEYDYTENPVNCSSDCRCGDNICSSYEICTDDCGTDIGECGDGRCNYNNIGGGKTKRETIVTCPEDCELSPL